MNPINAEVYRLAASLLFTHACSAIYKACQKLGEDKASHLKAFQEFACQDGIPSWWDNEHADIEPRREALEAYAKHLEERTYFVWIELERPSKFRKVDPAKVAELATQMLAKLGCTKEIAWDGEFYTYGDSMGSERLVEDGRWFDLSYLGR